MAVNVDDPTIPLNCEEQPATVLTADICAPEFNFGPISNIYFTVAPFAAPPTALEITRRLALADTDPTDPEALTLFLGTMLIGNGTPEFEEFNGRKYPKPTAREYPVSTKITSQVYYDFMRSTERGGLKRRAFGVSNDGKYWYGGQNGIDGVLNLSYNQAEEFTSVNTIAGNFSTSGFFSPKRIPSPVPAQ